MITSATDYFSLGIADNQGHMQQHTADRAAFIDSAGSTYLQSPMVLATSCNIESGPIDSLAVKTRSLARSDGTGDSDVASNHLPVPSRSASFPESLMPGDAPSCHYNRSSAARPSSKRHSSSNLMRILGIGKRSTNDACSNDHNTFTIDVSTMPTQSAPSLSPSSPESPSYAVKTIVAPIARRKRRANTMPKLQFASSDVVPSSPDEFARPTVQRDRIGTLLPSTQRMRGTDAIVPCLGYTSPPQQMSPIPHINEIDLPPNYEYAVASTQL